MSAPGSPWPGQFQAEIADRISGIGRFSPSLALGRRLTETFGTINAENQGNGVMAPKYDWAASITSVDRPVMRIWRKGLKR